MKKKRNKIRKSIELNKLINKRYLNDYDDFDKNKTLSTNFDENTSTMYNEFLRYEVFRIK